jgi:hypothetical protein
VRPFGKGEAAEVLHQRVLPEEFAVAGVGDAVAVAELEVDVARFRIDGRGADAVAAVNHVAEVVAEADFPEFLAGDGIQAEQDLPHVLAFLAVETERVELAIGDDRGAGSLDVVGPEFGTGLAFFRAGRIRARRRCGAGRANSASR